MGIGADLWSQMEALHNEQNIAGHTPRLYQPVDAEVIMPDGPRLRRIHAGVQEWLDTLPPGFTDFGLETLRCCSRKRRTTNRHRPRPATARRLLPLHVPRRSGPRAGGSPPAHAPTAGAGTRRRPSCHIRSPSGRSFNRCTPRSDQLRLGDQFGRRVRDQDLASVARGRDPGTPQVQRSGRSSHHLAHGR